MREVQTIVHLLLNAKRSNFSFNFCRCSLGTSSKASKSKTHFPISSFFLNKGSTAGAVLAYSLLINSGKMSIISPAFSAKSDKRKNKGKTISSISKF